MHLFIETTVFELSEITPPLNCGKLGWVTAGLQLRVQNLREHVWSWVKWGVIVTPIVLLTDGREVLGKINDGPWNLWLWLMAWEGKKRKINWLWRIFRSFHHRKNFVVFMCWVFGLFRHSFIHMFIHVLNHSFSRHSFIHPFSLVNIMH